MNPLLAVILVAVLIQAALLVLSWLMMWLVVIVTTARLGEEPVPESEALRRMVDRFWVTRLAFNMYTIAHWWQFLRWKGRRP